MKTKTKKPHKRGLPKIYLEKKTKRSYIKINKTKVYIKPDLTERQLLRFVINKLHKKEASTITAKDTISKLPLYGISGGVNNGVNRADELNKLNKHDITELEKQIKKQELKQLEYKPEKDKDIKILKDEIKLMELEYKHDITESEKKLKKHELKQAEYKAEKDADIKILKDEIKLMELEYKPNKKSITNIKEFILNQQKAIQEHNHKESTIIEEIRDEIKTLKKENNLLMELKKDAMSNPKNDITFDQQLQLYPDLKRDFKNGVYTHDEIQGLFNQMYNMSSNEIHNLNNKLNNTKNELNTTKKSLNDTREVKIKEKIHKAEIILKEEETKELKKLMNNKTRKVFFKAMATKIRNDDPSQSSILKLNYGADELQEILTKHYNFSIDPFNKKVAEKVEPFVQKLHKLKQMQKDINTYKSSGDEADDEDEGEDIVIENTSHKAKQSPKKATTKPSMLIEEVEEVEEEKKDNNSKQASPPKSKPFEEIYVSTSAPPPPPPLAPLAPLAQPNPPSGPPPITKPKIKPNVSLADLMDKKTLQTGKKVLKKFVETEEQKQRKQEIIEARNRFDAQYEKRLSKYMSSAWKNVRIKAFENERYKAKEYNDKMKKTNHKTEEDLINLENNKKRFGDDLNGDFIDKPFIDERFDEEDSYMDGLGRGSTEDDGMNTNDINNILGKYKGQYLGCIGSDQLNTIILPQVKPQTRICWVMNTSKSTAKDGGQHWLACLIDARPNGSHSIEYYNSLGNNGIEAMPKDFIKKITPILKKLQTNTYMTVKQNIIKEQNAYSSNCGEFACRFIIQRMNNKSFADATNWNQKGEKKIEEWKKKQPQFKFIPAFHK
jgi:hypothetical protein